MADEPGTETLTSMTLGEVLNEYLASLAPKTHNVEATFVRKYVEHIGPETVVTALSGARVESYAESQIQPSDPAAPQRVAALKSWFQYLKKQNYVEKNYGVHIRLKRTASRSGARRAQLREREAPIEMTAEGLASLREELDRLEAEVPDIVKAIATAREDKDFRENAPLDAAREALAFSEQRRREIQSTLKRAVAVDGDAGGDDRSTVGSLVEVTRLDTGATANYKLVGASEANAAEQKISVESPVGKELLGRRPGEEVSVSVPSGVVQFRIDSVSKG